MAVGVAGLDLLGTRLLGGRPGQQLDAAGQHAGDRGGNGEVGQHTRKRGHGVPRRGALTPRCYTALPRWRRWDYSGALPAKRGAVMSWLTCPSGHQWESLSDVPCPVCGALATAMPQDA